MAIRSLSEVPAGARLANTMTRVEGSNLRPADPGGMPYDPPTCTDRTKRDEPCGAQRANGTLFCAGHLRKRGEL